MKKTRLNRRVNHGWSLKVSTQTSDVVWGGGGHWKCIGGKMVFAAGSYMCDVSTFNTSWKPWSLMLSSKNIIWNQRLTLSHTNSPKFVYSTFVSGMKQVAHSTFWQTSWASAHEWPSRGNFRLDRLSSFVKRGVIHCLKNRKASSMNLSQLPRHFNRTWSVQVFRSVISKLFNSIEATILRTDECRKLTEPFSLRPLRFWRVCLSGGGAASLNFSFHACLPAFTTLL